MARGLPSLTSHTQPAADCPQWRRWDRSGSTFQPGCLAHNSFAPRPPPDVGPLRQSECIAQVYGQISWPCSQCWCATPIRKARRSRVGALSRLARSSECRLVGLLEMKAEPLKGGSPIPHCRRSLIRSVDARPSDGGASASATPIADARSRRVKAMASNADVSSRKEVKFRSFQVDQRIGRVDGLRHEKGPVAGPLHLDPTLNQ